MIRIPASNILKDPSHRNDTFMLNETIGLAPEWSYDNDFFYSGTSTFVFPDTDITFMDVISDIDKYVIKGLGRGLSNIAVVIRVGDKKYVLNRSHNPMGSHENKNQIYILSQLTGNSHFVQLIAAYVKDRHIYMLNPYIPGKTLNEWSQSPHTIEEKHIVLNQAKEALNELHRFGIIHGDAHLENIFVPDDLTRNNVFLIDFGRATYSSNTESHDLNFEHLDIRFKTNSRRSRKRNIRRSKTLRKQHK